MQKAIVSWDAYQSTEMAKIRVHKDYRWCRITFYPHFLQIPSAVQIEAVYHEIIHCYTIPLKGVACDILNNLLDEKNASENKLKKVYRQNIDETMESITQDFTYALMRKFEEKEFIKNR